MKYETTTSLVLPLMRIAMAAMLLPVLLTFAGNGGGGERPPVHQASHGSSPAG